MPYKMIYHLPQKFRFLNFRLRHFANIFEREDIRSVFMVYERKLPNKAFVIPCRNRKII